ncbi:MAG: HAMP domain-containing histidine kinase [Candidatus Gastranaerophilales bacterium]|nr:HAMP domain-containing histidine kinase [Candidatus Gastranaerophilales bacterium]
MNTTEQNYEDFISTVSHELRTPLTSIRGFSQTMLASWDKLDDNSKQKFIKIIEEQSNRLIHLVENMLSVTKLQSKNNTLVFNELNIKSPIEQIISIIKNQYPTQLFEFQYRENLPAIFVDKDKFQQIMTNLIENSAKYSTDSNTTKISAGMDNNSVIIKVTNIGINISSEDYEKIFTKFSRIDNPLTRKVQGSGLGLYITKNLTEKMRGEIFVNSTPLTQNPKLGEITFTLKFPILSIEEQARIKCNQ